jgi:hypothetical protein
MENRNGLAVNTRITKASGKAETQAAIDMLGELPGKGRITVGGNLFQPACACCAISLFSN